MDDPTRSPVDRFGKDVVKQYILNELSSIMTRNNVSPGVQKFVVFMIENADNYIEYCRKASKQPTDAEALREFIINKTITTLQLSTMSGENIACGVSILTLINNLRKNFPMAEGGVGAIIVVMMTLNDLISVGNECPYLQEVWYHAFYQTSHPLVKNRCEVPFIDPIKTIRATSAGMSASVKNRCDGEILQNRMFIKKMIQDALRPNPVPVLRP